MNGNRARVARGFGLAPNVNEAFMADIYPTTPGPTLGMKATQYGDRGLRTVAATEAAAAARTSDLAVPASPPRLLAGGITFLVLLAVLMWSAHKIDGGTGDNFRNIKASAYNIFVIGLAAILFLVPAKYLATRFRVPGISTWVQAA